MSKQKQYSFEVDQSIRIEETNRDTIIGVANKQNKYAYVLPRKIKRHFNEEFRRLGISKRFGPILFANAIILVVRAIKIKPKSLVLDVEYPGYENLIKKIILTVFPDINISYRQIGKSSPAHEAAYFTHTRKRRPDGKITHNELHAVIKKTTGELLHLEFTRIRSPHRSVKNKYTKKRRKIKGVK